MRRRFLIASLASGLLFASIAFSQQQFSSVEERMSSADFKAAGLDKLSPEELAKLNAFIRSEMQARTAAAREEGIREQNTADAARMGFRDYSGDTDEITSTISGRFNGWEGGTVFHLANGQTWRQVDGLRFAVHLDNPVVHIKPGLMGTWTLQVEGYGSYAKVERVQ